MTLFRFFLAVSSELLLYACLGIAAAFVAQLFTEFSKTEELFKKYEVPVWLPLGGWHLD